ncbi:hypothetical protein diail_8826 [Diaporthe ilicicola]|nr:hypothetical protein diail_8826 [Diaporthe ilicicola]
MNESSRPFLPSPNVRGEEQQEPPSTPTTNRAFGRGGPEQQLQQLLTPQTPSSSSRQQGGGGWIGGLTSTGGDGPSAQPGDPRARDQQQRRQIFYPGVSTRQQRPSAPAPYQSNGRKRRRTQVELQMHHAIAWLGYGEVVPNVSVVTSEPLVLGPVHTHGTRRTGASKEEDDDNDKIAVRTSRALMTEVNKRAAKKQKGLESRHG